MNKEYFQIDVVFNGSPLHPFDPIALQLKKELASALGYSEMGETFIRDIDDLFSSPQFWPYWEDDLKDITRAHPGVEIYLKVVRFGEDSSLVYATEGDIEYLK